MNFKVQNHLMSLKEKDKRFKKHIYIIGAGISGLIAGYELKKLGHQVTLIEGSNRVGGRIFTHRFCNENPTLYGELGAMRFSSSHDYVFHYIHEFRLDKKIREFIGLFENENCFFNIKNNLFKNKDFLNTRIINTQSVDILKEILLTFLPDGIKSLITTMDMRDIKFPAFNLDNEKIYYFSLVSLIEDFAQALATKNPSLNLSIQNLAIGRNKKFYRLKDGMDQLPLKISEKLAPSIIYSAEVCQINNLDNKAEIKIYCKGKYETIICDYLICTIPFSVMREMSLKNFSARKLEAIHNLKYINACKILLLCKDKFWERHYNIQGGASITDGFIRQIYYPCESFNEKVHLSNDSPGVLLNYTAGQMSDYISSLTHDQRITLAKEAIGLFHKEIHEKEMIVNSSCITWDTYKWSKGGFSFMCPNHAPTFAIDENFKPTHEYINFEAAQLKLKSGFPLRLYQNTVQPEGRIFFAGEHCSLYQGWIQGAILSALQAVESIVSH